MKFFKLSVVLLVSLVMFGCANTKVSSFNYTEFRQADPLSILVLPPINNTTEVLAPYSVMAQVIAPISEAGFYTLPVALVEQTFRNNGLTVANDIHALPKEKLHEIFGADTALYLDIHEYGTSYIIISSDTVVSISARLVDLKTGNVLWQKSATASSAETRSNNDYRNHQHCLLCLTVKVWGRPVSATAWHCHMRGLKGSAKSKAYLFCWKSQSNLMLLITCQSILCLPCLLLKRLALIT